MDKYAHETKCLRDGGGGGGGVMDGGGETMTMKVWWWWWGGVSFNVLIVKTVPKEF